MIGRGPVDTAKMGRGVTMLGFGVEKADARVFYNENKSQEMTDMLKSVGNLPAL